MIKKLLLTAACAFTIIGASAQTNGGFETWGQPFSEPEEPTGWITANVFASPFVSTMNPTSCFKATTTNVFAGTYAMRLQTVVLVNNPDSATIPDTLGYAVQGTVTLFPSFSIVDRIGYTARPNAMHFASKYTPSGIDTAYCYVELTKWNNTLMQRDTLGWMAMIIPAGANYSVYTPPIIYDPAFNTVFPDSLHISFSASGFTIPKPGSSLWVDDIYFTGWNGVADVHANAINLTAFPNPATEMVTITANIENAVTLKVYDCIGKTIGTFVMSDMQYKLNTSAWMPGNYFYSVMDKDGIVLAGNTFTVAK